MSEQSAPPQERGKNGARQQGVGKRRRAREMALQMLYQLELGGSEPLEVFAAFDVVGYGEGEAEDEEVVPTLSPRQRRLSREAFDYARRLVEGSLEDGDSIDDLIRTYAENWRLERMPAIDRNILRLAVYEMLHESSVPKVVIVDEAIELAKKFGSENSGRFVNGLLDGILQGQEATAVERG